MNLNRYEVRSNGKVKSEHIFRWRAENKAKNLRGDEAFASLFWMRWARDAPPELLRQLITTPVITVTEKEKS